MSASRVSVCVVMVSVLVMIASVCVVIVSECAEPLRPHVRDIIWGSVYVYIHACVARVRL